MRNLFFLLLLFSFAECNDSSTANEPVTVKDTLANTAGTDPSSNYIHTFNDTVLENKVREALMKLPFVRASNAYIDSFSDHKHGIAFMLDSLGKNEKEISVQAGYNGDQRFETYYRFYIDPKTLEIKVYDAVSDKKLSVSEYLKTQK